MLNNLDEYGLLRILKDVIPENVVATQDEVEELLEEGNDDVESLADWLDYEYASGDDTIGLINTILRRLVLARTMLGDKLVIGLPEADNPRILVWDKEVEN